MNSGGVFDLDGLRRKLSDLEGESARPDLWENREEAERVLREKRAVEREVNVFDELGTLIEDVEVLLELAVEEEDAAAFSEVAEKLQAICDQLDEAELCRLLSGEYDHLPAIVSINSGEGGTDASDWAEMLLRMYTRWAEQRGYRCEILDFQPAEEAGIRSATLTVTGEYAFGYMKAEEGVHRLVRISPFGSGARRQTSFASVSVFPEIDDSIEVEIDDADLRIDTYRASGAGGQHVNKTDSAVRITHQPTGIVVQCQNERSQHKNKSSAMKVLRAKLFERMREQQEEKMDSLRGEKRKIGFGSQIRSYTLHPSQRVKDHRTNHEIGNAMAVLDGQLDDLIRATLLHQSGADGG